MVFGASASFLCGLAQDPFMEPKRALERGGDGYRFCPAPVVPSFYSTGALTPAVRPFTRLNTRRFEPFSLLETSRYRPSRLSVGDDALR